MAPSTYLTEETAPLLHTSTFGRSLRGYDTVASTNRIAARWADDGAPHGSVVTAEHQTHGRGRQGRTWSDAPGKNLLFSLVLRPSLDDDARSLLSITAAVAVSGALDTFVQPLRTELKWPNDILLEGHKCGGMLLESSLNGERPSADNAVVLGIGINVNQTTFPEALTDQSTSLLLACGRPLSRSAVLAHTLGELERWYEVLASGEVASILQAYNARFATLHTEITLYRHRHLEPIRGTVLGITAEGALRLRLPGGERVFHAGDVTTHLPN